jgi:hypothetical protein
MNDGRAMSLQTRQWVVNHPHTKFRGNSSDILDPNKTNTAVIAHIVFMLERGHIILFTAINSDHHDDLYLNPTPPHEGTHAGKCAYDCWPLNSEDPSDYATPGDAVMNRFLTDGGECPYTYQVGEGGSAYTPGDVRIALGTHSPTGDFVFQDDGSDHVHFGTVFL